MLLTAIGEFFTASRTTNVPSVVSNAMSFEASALSVAGCDAGQPFAFVVGLGDASVVQALSVSVAASASDTTEVRMLLRVQAASGSQNCDCHGCHQEHLADDNFDRRNLIEKQRRKNGCRWRHGECAE